MSDDSVQVWRVETRDGVVDVHVSSQAFRDGVTWSARSSRCGRVSGYPTPRGAVAALLSLDVVDVPILAPGEPTRAELLAVLAASARGELPVCHECERTATLRAEESGHVYAACDEHRGDYAWETLPHAAVLRAVMLACPRGAR